MTMEIIIPQIPYKPEIENYGSNTNLDNALYADEDADADADYTFMDEKEFLELNEYGTPSGRHRSSSSNGNS